MPPRWVRSHRARLTPSQEQMRVSSIAVCLLATFAPICDHGRHGHHRRDTSAAAKTLTKTTLAWHDWRPVGIAAVLALLLGGGLLAVFGRVSPYDRPEVLDSLTNAVFWLAASMIGACGTIAALMLTTVGLLEHLETERLTPRFLFHLRLIVTSALATIALAVLALLLTVFPTSGAGDVSPNAGLLAVVYWSLLVVTALMIGGFATVLGGLYTTIGEIFRTLPSDWVEGDPDRFGGDIGGGVRKALPLSACRSGHALTSRVSRQRNGLTGLCQ